MKPLHLITIGFAKHALQKGSREHARMQMYARNIASFSIIVFTRRAESFREVVEEGGLKVYPTNSRTRVSALFDGYRIARNICITNPDKTFIISAQDPLEMGLLAWILSFQKNVRLHIQVHGDYFCDGWMGRSLIRRIRRYGALLLLRRAKAVRVVSERIKASLCARGVEEEAITVLPIRPELEAFLSMTPETRSNVFRFLYVGRLAPEKDVERILRAFALEYAENPKTELRIVGSGKEESVLKRLAQTLAIQDVVTWIPWTEQIAEEMSQADTLVLASKHEAYALVLVEAMAAALPVVTTDVGCVGEVVKDGVHGCVVREAGDAPFAHAMHRMSTDEEFRTSCSIHGREDARRIAEVSNGAYVDAWVSALRKALD